MDTERLKNNNKKALDIYYKWEIQIKRQLWLSFNHATKFLLSFNFTNGYREIKKNHLFKKNLALKRIRDRDQNIVNLCPSIIFITLSSFSVLFCLVRSNLAHLITTFIWSSHPTSFICFFVILNTPFSLPFTSFTFFIYFIRLVSVM